MSQKFLLLSVENGVTGRVVAEDVELLLRQGKEGREFVVGLDVPVPKMLWFYLRVFPLAVVPHILHDADVPVGGQDELPGS